MDDWGFAFWLRLWRAVIENSDGRRLTLIEMTAKRLLSNRAYSDREKFCSHLGKSLLSRFVRMKFLSMEFLGVDGIGSGEAQRTADDISCSSLPKTHASRHPIGYSYTIAGQGSTSKLLRGKCVSASLGSSTIYHALRQTRNVLSWLIVSPS